MIGHERHDAHDQPLPYISVYQVCMDVRDHLIAVQNILKHFTHPYTCISSPLCITHKNENKEVDTLVQRVDMLTSTLLQQFLASHQTATNIRQQSAPKHFQTRPTSNKKKSIFSLSMLNEYIYNKLGL